MTNQGKRTRRGLIWVGRALRDGWLILGATVVLVLFVEVVFRVQAAVRTAVGDWSQPAEPEPPSPFEEFDWAADYWIGHEKEEAVRWAPYVYLRNPTFEAPYASTDSLGHRITPHPPPNGGEPLRVFFMGGSTTFGWYQRADHTIPAEAVRRLQAELGDSVQVEATNFGVPGHTFTQEIIELMLQLRAGARPDVVVFYDGINDVMATVQNGVAGLPQNEGNRRYDFALGRRIAAENQPGMRNELRAIRRMAVAAAKRLHFVRAALKLVRGGAWVPAPIDSLAQSSVRVYAENVRLVEALAAAYGFQPLYIWQPALLSSKKPLTAREAWLRVPQRIGDLHEAIPELIGPAVSPIVGGRFIDATTLFDDDSLEVFVDMFGHTYERANPRIVDTIMPQLTAAAVRSLSSR